MIEMPKITYQTVDLRSLKMVRANAKKLQKITSVNIDGRSLSSTDRFIGSFCSLNGISPSIFSYFTPDEVVNRIIDVKGESREKIRVAIEEKTEKILAVSQPGKPLLTSSEVEMVFTGRSNAAQNIVYSEGVMWGEFAPNLGANDFTIKADKFANKFIVEIPIDGYGLPSSYLSMLRYQCTNMQIAYCKTFKSTVQLGKKDTEAVPVMNRFIDNFNNEEGFSAIRQRLESALNSPASLDELFSLNKLLEKEIFESMHVSESGVEVAPTSSLISKKLRELAGSMEIYGLVSYESISQKKRRTIPTSGTIYDLMNFATELATHNADAIQSRSLQAWFGNLISKEYDLENVLNNNEQPQDLFINN